MKLEDKVVEWYHVYKRDLPWRDTKEAYKIWISEVILQQTRIKQGLDYYNNFLLAFPDVYVLAHADEENVLKVWQGLGYYTRARNLHSTAKYIVHELKGNFPTTYNEIIKLKGIGEYTAAAIASFVYGEKVPVLDGNVYRVYARIFAIEIPTNSAEGKKIFKSLAFKLIQSQNAAVFNQAIMEFGALQCLPKNPPCQICPVNNVCKAYVQDRVRNFPVKIKSDKQKNRYFHYFHFDNQGYTYLRKRDKNDIWKGLYEFPMLETSEPQEFVNLIKVKEWSSIFNNSAVILKETSRLYIHALSHQKIHTLFYKITCLNEDNLPVLSDYIKVRADELHLYPVSKLIENYLNHQDNEFVN